MLPAKKLAVCERKSRLKYCNRIAMASSVFKRCFTRGRKLVDAGSVVTVSESEWIVEKHIVKREPDGRIRCSCAGYKSKNICPHVAAVAITRGI